MLRCSSSVKGKPLNLLTRRVGNVIDGQLRRRPNESWDKDLPSTKCQRPSRRADEEVEVRATSCPLDGKLSLKADESQIGQRNFP